MGDVDRIFFVEDAWPELTEVEMHYQNMVEGFGIVFALFCDAWERVEREYIETGQGFVDAWRNKQWELVLDLMEGCTDLPIFTAMMHLLYEEANEHSLPILRLLDHERRLYARWLKEVFEQRAHRWQANLARNFPGAEEQQWILGHIPKNT